MRVILEMSEDDLRSLTIERHVLAGGASSALDQSPVSSAGTATLDVASALDGGAPSAALLMAVDGKIETVKQQADRVERQGGISAGGAPDWLTGSLGHTSVSQA